MGFLDTLKSIVGYGEKKPQPAPVAPANDVSLGQKIRNKTKEVVKDNIVSAALPVPKFARDAISYGLDQVKKIDPATIQPAVDKIPLIGNTWVGDYIGSALSSAVNIPRAVDDVKNAKGFKQNATAITQLGVDAVNAASLVPMGGAVTGTAKGLRALGKAGISAGLKKGIISPVVNAVKNNAKQIVGAFTADAGKGLLSKAIQPARALYSGVSNIFSKITSNQAAKAFSLHNAPLGFSWVGQAIEGLDATMPGDYVAKDIKPLEKMGFTVGEFSDFRKDILTGIPKVIREEDIPSFERRISKHGYNINDTYSTEQKILTYNKLAKDLKDYIVSDSYKPIKNTVKEMTEILGSAGIFGNKTVQTSLLDGAEEKPTVPTKKTVTNLVQDENEYSKEYINTMQRILGKTPSDRSVYRLVENARNLQLQKENLQENIFDGIMQGMQANPELAKEKAGEIVAYKNFVENAYVDRANVLPYYSAYKEAGLTDAQAVDKSIIAYMKDKKGIVNSADALAEWDKSQTIDGMDITNAGVALKASLSLSSFGKLEEKTSLLGGSIDQLIKSKSDRFTQAGFRHLIEDNDDTEFSGWKRKLVEKAGETSFLLAQHAIMSRTINKILNNKKIDTKGTRAFGNVTEDFFDNAAVAGLTAEQTDNTEYLIGGIIELFSAAGSMTTSAGYKNPGLTGGGSDKVKETINIKTPPDDGGGGNLPPSEIDPEGIAQDIARAREQQLERKSTQSSELETGTTLTVDEANELEFLRTQPVQDSLAEFYREPIREAYDTINVFAKEIANRTSSVLDPLNRNKEAQKIYADIEGMEGRYKLLTDTASNLGVNISSSYSPEQALQDINTEIESLSQQGTTSDQTVDIDIQQKRLAVVTQIVEQKDEIKRAEKFIKSKVRDGSLNMEGINFDDYSRKVSGKIYKTYNDPVEGAVRTLNNVDGIQKAIEGVSLTATETEELLKGSGAQKYDASQTMLNRLFDKLVELNNSYGDIQYVVTSSESVPYSLYDSTLDVIYINGSLSPAERRIEVGKQLMTRVTSKVFKEGDKAKGKNKEYQEAVLSIHEIFLKKLKQDKKITKDEKMYLSQFSDPAKFAAAIFDPVLKKYMEGMKASKISGGMKIFERLIRAVSSFLGITGLDESKWQTVYGLFFGVTEAYIDSFWEKSYQAIERDIKKTMAEENIINVKGENDKASLVEDTMNQSKVILDKIVKGKDENMEGLFEEIQEKKEILQKEIVDQDNSTITRSVAKSLNRVLTEVVELKKAEMFPSDKVNSTVVAYMESYNNALKVGVYDELVALKPGAESSIVANTTDQVLSWIDSVLPYIFDWSKLIDDTNVNNFNLDKVKIFKSYMTSVIRNGDYNMHMALVDAKESGEKKAAFIIGRVLSENISLSSFDASNIFQDNFALDISSGAVKEFLENTYENFVPYISANINDIMRGAKSNIQSHNVYARYLQEKNRDAVNDIKRISSDPATEYGTYVSSVFGVMRGIISSGRITEDRFVEDYTSILKDAFTAVDPGLWLNSAEYIGDMLERYENIISNFSVGVRNFYRVLTDDQEFAEMQRDLSDSVKLIKEAQERNAPINMIGNNLNLSVEKALAYFNIGLLKAGKGYDILKDASSYPVEVIKTLGHIMGVYEGTAGLYDASILGEEKVANLPGQYTSFLEDVAGTIQSIRDSFAQGVSVGAWKSIIVNEYLATQAMYGNNLAKNFYVVMRELGFLDTNISFLDNDIGSALSYTVASVYQDYKDSKENYINNRIRDQNKVEPGSMVFLIGKSGSGKTTYAKQWKDVEGYKVVSVDDYIPLEYLSKTVPANVWEIILEQVDQAIIQHINNGQVVIYDATNLSTKRYKVPKEKLKKIRGATGKTVKGYGLVFDIDEATRLENLSLKENQIPAEVNKRQSKNVIDMDGLTPVNNMLQPIGIKAKVGTLMEGIKTALGIDVQVDKTIDAGVIYRNKKVFVNPDNIDLNRKLDKSMDHFFAFEVQSSNGKRIDLSKVIQTEGDLFNSYTMDLVYMTQYGNLPFRNVLGNKIINDYLLANEIPLTLEQDATKYAVSLFDKYVSGTLTKEDLPLSGSIPYKKVKSFFYELGVLLGRTDELNVDITLSNQQLLSDVNNFEVKMRKDLFDEVSRVYAPNKLFNMPEVKGMSKNNAINYIIDNFYDGILETIAPKTNQKLMEIVQRERDRYNISLEKMRNRLDVYNRRKLGLLIDDYIPINEEIVLPYNRFLDGNMDPKNIKIGLKMVFDMKSQVFLRQNGNKFLFVDITGVPVANDPGKTYRVILNGNSDQNFQPVEKLLEDNGFKGKVSTLPNGVYMFLNKGGTVDLRTISENSYNLLLKKNVNGFLEDGLKFAERQDAKLILEENKKIEGFVNQYTVVNQKRIASLRRYREGQNEGKLITTGNVGKNNEVVKTILEGKWNKKDRARGLVNYSDMVLGTNISKDSLLLNIFAENMENGTITNEEVLSTVFSTDITDLQKNIVKVIKKGMEIDDLQSYGKIDDFNSKQNIFEALTREGYAITEKVANDINTVYEFLKGGKFREYLVYSLDNVEEYQVFKAENQIYFDALGSLMAIDNTTINKIIDKVNQEEIDIALERVIDESKTVAGEFEKEDIGTMYASMGMSFTNKSVSRELKMFSWLFNKLGGTSLDTEGNVSTFKEGGNYINIDTLAGSVGLGFMVRADGRTLDNTDGLLEVANILETEWGLTPEKIQARIKSISSKGNNKSQVLGLSDNELAALKSYLDHFGSSDSTTSITDIITAMFRDPLEEGSSGFSNIEKNVVSSIAILSQMREVSLAFFIGNTNFPGDISDMMTDLYGQINPNALRKIGYRTLENISSEINTSINSGKKGTMFLNELKNDYGYLPNVSEWIDAIAKTESSTRAIDGLASLSKAAHILYQNIMLGRVQAINVINKKSKLMTEQSARDLIKMSDSFFGQDELGRMIIGENLKDQRTIDEMLTEDQIEKQGERNKAGIEKENPIIQVDEMLFGKEENSYISKKDLTTLSEAGKGDFINVRTRIDGILNGSQFRKSQITSFMNRYRDLLPEGFVSFITSELNSSKGNLKERLKTNMKSHLEENKYPWHEMNFVDYYNYFDNLSGLDNIFNKAVSEIKAVANTDYIGSVLEENNMAESVDTDPMAEAKAMERNIEGSFQEHLFDCL